MDPPSESLAQTSPPPHRRQQQQEAEEEEEELEEILMRPILLISLSRRTIRIMTEILWARKRRKFTREIFSYCGYGVVVRSALSQLMLT